MKLTQKFYERDTLLVAQELLGKELVHFSSEGKTSGMIIEVEAYLGPEDQAAHSYGGLRTTRTEAMFAAGGHAYVFLIYGCYTCFNIVSHVQNSPQAVLIRALEPLTGIDLMKKRRNTHNIKNLCSGPGKLTMAMGITREHNLEPLWGEKLFLTAHTTIPQSQILATPRIHIDYADAWKLKPWRFLIRDHPLVSKG